MKPKQTPAVVDPSDPRFPTPEQVRVAMKVAGMAQAMRVWEPAETAPRRKKPARSTGGGTKRSSKSSKR